MPRSCTGESRPRAIVSTKAGLVPRYRVSQFATSSLNIVVRAGRKTMFSEDVANWLTRYLGTSPALVLTIALGLLSPVQERGMAGQQAHEEPNYNSRPVSA